jgi:hypothetical protein
MKISISKGDNSMRKLFALIILTVVFFPLAVAAMTLTAIRPWVLDRNFYERLVSDEQLYDALLTGELPNQFNRFVFVDKDQLPLGALSIALREVVTASYLRTQSVAMINQVFDFIDGRKANFEVSFDVSSLKIALGGEAGIRFAKALAASLPFCEVGQEAITPGGTLVRCIAANSSITEAGQQIARALPTALEDAPDHIILNDSMNFQNDWRFVDWFRAGTIRSTLDLSILIIIFTTLATGLVGAFLGGNDLRAQLRWFGSSLFVPASLFVLMGVIIATPLIAGPLRDGLNADRWNGIPFGEAFREAIVGMITPLMQQIGNGFLITGGETCLIALGLFAWSWSVTATEHQSGKLVQVPVRNS